MYNELKKCCEDYFYQYEAKLISFCIQDYVVGERIKKRILIETYQINH